MEKKYLGKMQVSKKKRMLLQKGFHLIVTGSIFFGLIIRNAINILKDKKPRPSSFSAAASYDKTFNLLHIFQPITS